LKNSGESRFYHIHHAVLIWCIVIITCLGLWHIIFVVETLLMLKIWKLPAWNFSLPNQKNGILAVFKNSLKDGWRPSNIMVCTWILYMYLIHFYNTTFFYLKNEILFGTFFGLILSTTDRKTLKIDLAS